MPAPLMRVVRLASEIDFAGWRAAARALRQARAAPEEVLWTVDGEGDLFAEALPPPAAAAPAFTVPREFMSLADAAILHRSDERFALLYRLLRRLGDEPHLMRVASDPDVARVREFAAHVGRAAHRMKAFVRFRRVSGPDQPETYVAWFEPAHRVTERTAPFFVRRLARMRFSILTPDACIHYDGERLIRSPGADPVDAPAADGLEDYWRTGHAASFDPARRKAEVMGCGRNPPAARPIPQLIEAAEDPSPAMVAQRPSEPSRRGVRAARRAARDAPYDGAPSADLDELVASVQLCRRCDLWRDATQGVPGEGPARARLMLVGEQPGDQEDLAGRPFVGPAGQMLDQAIAAAGVPRDQAYVTNAVKHFKHELRGKRRLHKTPDADEVQACRWWLQNERRLVGPRVIVALGATAIMSVFGKAMPVSKARQQALQLPDQAQGVVTYHPSYLLRVPDAAAKAAAYEMFVEDLAFAWKLAG